MPCSAQLTAGGISNGRNHSGGELAAGGVGEQAGGRGGGGSPCVNTNSFDGQLTAQYCNM